MNATYQPKWILFLLIFLGAIIPFSTDLYLPALPGMASSFNASVSEINVTLMLFMVFFALGVLIWGPLSDKYGRKRILLIGLSIYSVASLFCAMANSLETLITFRVLQAVGGGVAPSISLAIARDIYSGRELETRLSIIQAASMLAPIIAPMVGSIILIFFSWHSIFWILFGFGLIALTGVALMRETAQKQRDDRTKQSLGSLVKAAKNAKFLSLLPVFTIGAGVLMSFVSASSYIYINDFGVSEQVYGLYYSLNAAFLVAGPLVFMALRAILKPQTIILSGFALSAISGLLVMLFGGSAPWAFCVSFLPFSLMSGMIRPIGTRLLLTQQPHNLTGSASSLITFTYMSVGALGTLFISQEWKSRVFVLGALCAVYTVVSFTLWMVFSRKYKYFSDEDAPIPPDAA
jgi:DHA1 family bicyclomycin/chloramphenicol resistance-like MFS transporter